MVKKIVLLCSAVLIIALLPLSCIADISVPEGFDVTVPLADISITNITSGFSIVDYPSEFSFSQILTSLDDRSLTLRQMLLSYFPDFSLYGYLYNNSPKSCTARFLFTFESGYENYYVVCPRFFISSTGHSQFYRFTTSQEHTSSGTLSADLTWGNDINDLVSTTLYYSVYAFSSNVVSMSATINYGSFWGNYNSAVDIPVFMPLCFSTQEGAEAFVRNSLSKISGKLDDIEDGLFTPSDDAISDMSRTSSMVSDTRSRVDQALADASVPQFNYSRPDISIDGEAVSQGFKVVNQLTWLLPIFGTAVGCWITHLILFGVGKK